MTFLASVRNRNSGFTGFTLLELLLVITLIGVMTAVVFPRLQRSVRSSGLREGADDLAMWVRFARAEAVRRGLRTRLCVDKGKNLFWIEVQDSEGVRADSFVGFDDPWLAAQHNLPDGVRILRIVDGSGGAPYLPPSLEPAVASSPGSSLRMEFSPDGVSPAKTIHLTGSYPDSRRYLVELGSWYDEVRVAIAPRSS